MSVDIVRKKRFIKNNVSLLPPEIKTDFYLTIKTQCPVAIRTGSNLDGVYVDLDYIDDSIICNIYNVLKDKKRTIH